MWLHRAENSGLGHRGRTGDFLGGGNLMVAFSHLPWVLVWSGFGSLGPKEKLGIGVAGRAGVVLPFTDGDPMQEPRTPSRTENHSVRMENKALGSLHRETTSRPPPPKTGSYASQSGGVGRG